MTPHVDPPQWPVLLSSRADDEERSSALAHAKECPPCAGERDRAERLLAELSSAPQVALPSPEALSRVKATVLAASWDAGAGLFGWEAPAVFTVFALILGLSQTRAQSWLSWGGAVALLFLAVAAIRMRPGTAVATGTAGGLGVAALLGLQPTFELGHAAVCSGMELLGAMMPVAALWLAAKTRALSPTPASFAAAAAAGALGGQAALVVACPSHAFFHVAVFHVGAILLATAMGAILGKSLTPAELTTGARVD